MTDRDQLDIAEILFDTGEVQFRYARYLAEDRSRWIRHGLFRSYHRDGTLRSEGLYEDGLMTGIWRDYHENGRLAAHGEYVQGKEHGLFRFWGSDGTEEQSVEYREGEQV